VELSSHRNSWQTKSTDNLIPAEPEMVSEPEAEVSLFPEMNLDDVLMQDAFSCEVEFLRYYHLQLMEVSWR
jgi:hypothetical protein